MRSSKASPARRSRPPRLAIGAALVVGGVAACARQGAPPGGPTDNRPPIVIRTTPESFEVVEDLDVSIRFDFNERISERAAEGSLDDAFTISPRIGEVKVGHGRRSLTIDPEDGLAPGVVYRVTLEPVVSDLFSNTMQDPFELVFTTGADPIPTTLAGEVWDRVTGRGMAGATVQAVGGDSLVHEATSSQDGIYAFRYLPEGAFRVTGFDDLDRDAQLGEAEPRGVAAVAIASGDTLFLDVAVLAPDTVPANVANAEAVDSVTVLVVFDDFLDPSEDGRGDDGGGLA